MLREHELGRECVKKMKAAFQRNKAGEPLAAKDFLHWHTSVAPPLTI
jgi:hemerythrin-like domain-containing protein